MKLAANATIETLTNELKSLGVKANKLDKAVSMGCLPESGIFEEYKVEGSAILQDGTDLSPDNPATESNPIVQDFRHIKVYADNGDSISLSRLQARGFLGEIDREKDIIASRDGKKFFLRTNHTVNESLQGNQASVLMRIMGKSFEAEKITIHVTEYDEKGYKSADKVVTKTQDSYKITLDD